MGTPNYDIDYDDKRLTQVTSEKEEALKESDKLYDGMVSANQTKEQGLLDQINANVKEQTKIQNENTEFAIEQIEQQKEQAKKDYTKEQSGAYVDWQKASNQYGANAEQMAANGLTNTGFSESSRVSMYNQYQNRVATARESYNLAVLNYNNAIKDARLQNNAVLAEIAAKALEQQLEITLSFVQINNTLLTQKANARTTIDQNYHNRYMDVLGQINTENALAENVRQFNEQMEEEKRQYNETLALQKEQFAWQKAQAAKSASISKSSGSSKSNNGSGKTDRRSTKYASNKVVNNKNHSSNSTNVSKGEPTPDMNSVLALGYGPISAAKLNELVKSGKVVEVEKNGKLYYSKRFAG